MILVMLLRVRVQMNLTTAGSFLGISCFRFSFISQFFGDKIYWLKPSVVLAWLVVYLQFTSCTQGWHTKLLRDRSLHLLAKGSVTTWQFSKKKCSICPRSWASILYRAQSFDTHSEYASSHCHHDIPITALERQGIRWKPEPQTGVERQAPS